jgi:hypothetical protein
MTEPIYPVMPDFCDRGHPFHYTTALTTLAGLGIDLGRIDLMAVGRYTNYRGEIHEQEPNAGDVIHEDTRVSLKVGISSAVDFLPYQFFFGGDQWEERARALMAPFDGAVIRHAAMARHLSLRFNQGLADRSHLERVLSLFRFRIETSSVDPHEPQAWAGLLPRFHHWAGNAFWTEKLLARFFPWHFRVIENSPRSFAIPRHLTERLGSQENRLGRTSVIGRTFRENDSGYDVVIDSVTPGQVPHLFPGAPTRRKLEWMLSVCMPAGLDGRVRVHVRQRGIRLGTEPHRAYLGYATRL